MKKIRFTAIILVFALLFTSIQPPTSAEAATGDAEQAVQGDDIKNPENGKWSYIYFGSYPQTEVTGEDLTDDIVNADYYKGDATVDGVQYRRIYMVHSTSSGNEGKFFYFRYEPIRWRVLQKTDDKLLIMSDIGLDIIPYHTTEASVAWSESQMRDWLNKDNATTVYEPLYNALVPDTADQAYKCEEDNLGCFYYVKNYNKQENIHSFYQTAFTSAQRKAIIAQGDDKIFLLTASDLKNPDYGFGTADKLSSRIIQISDYTHKKNGRYWEKSIRQYPWWLRPESGTDATAAGSEGNIIAPLPKANDNTIVCVPAMYINISSDQWISEEKRLANEKENALNTLYAYDTSDYHAKEGVSLFHALREGRDAIDKAADIAAVDRALDAAKKKIDSIKTIGQYDRETVLAKGDSLNPVHHHDTSMSGVTDLETLTSEANPDYTDWNYIYFGVYPQTKVAEADDELGTALFDEGVEEEDYYGYYVRYKGKKYYYDKDKYVWYEVEPIKWRILQVEDNQLFLASDKRLTDYYMTYNGGTSTAEWISSPMKTFLNHNAYQYQYFKGQAFRDKEIKAIVTYDKLDTYGTKTASEIYTLSTADATNETYGFCPTGTLPSRSRQMRGTQYVTRPEDKAFIQLRDYSTKTKYFDSIEAGGSIASKRSGNSSGGYTGVVPALRLSLDEKYASYWSLSKPAADADIKTVLETWDTLEAQYNKEDCSEAQWAKVQESMDKMLEGLVEWKDAQEIADIAEDTKQDLDKILEGDGLQEEKDTAKAELESFRDDNDKYSEEQQQQRESIITAGIAAIEAAQDKDAITAALQEAKDELAKIVPEEKEESVFPPEIEKALRDRTFKTIDGGKQAMYSADHELTIEVFAYTTCPYSGSALEYLQAMELPEDKVDIFSVEIYGANTEAIRAWADQWRLDTQKITLCYNTAAPVQVGSSFETVARNDLRQYSIYYLDGKTDAGVVLTTPTYVFRDNTGKILKVVKSWQDKTKLTEILTSIGYGHLLPGNEDPGDDDPGNEDPSKTTIEAEFDVTYNQTEARQMLSRINEFRTGDGAWEWNKTNTEKVLHTDLGGLTYDYELEKVAMQRAADLVAAYSHTRPDGEQCFAAYPDSFAMASLGENIAVGYTTEEAVFTAWKEENERYSGQGHRRNMLSKNFQAVGIAHVVYNGCHYWVQEFSSKIVDSTEKAANDSKTAVKVTISKDAISAQELKTEAKSVEMKAGESLPLPQAYSSVRTKETWKSGPALEFPVKAKWSISSGEDVVSISEGTLQALKGGEAKLTASYNDKTTEIQIIVAKGLTTKEDFEEKLSEYEGKFADYDETEEEELKELLKDIKGELEDALAKEDLEAANAALAKMEAALKEKATGKKEEAKQELDGLKGGITADEELDESQKAEIEAELRAAETAIANAKDATEVKEELARVKAKIEEIKTKSAELKNARSEALNELDALEAKLGDYRAAEQEKIRNALEAARNEIAAAKDAQAVRDALAAANAVVQEQPTDAELTEREEENNNKNKVTKITISAPSKKIAAGKKVTLSAKVTPSNAENRRVKWSVNNKNYASVTQKGVVTVKKAGAGKSVKVTATALDGSGKKATITISIMQGAVKKVKLKAAKTVKAGKTLKIKATVSVTNKKANKTLKWATSNKKYATVNAKGVVSAKKTAKGKKVKITATATDGTNKKASVTIKIK